MGNRVAVDVAQEAHSNLLKRADCLGRDTSIRGHHAVPDTKLLEALVIDDYATLCKLMQPGPIL